MTVDDSAARVAVLMREENVGFLPVVTDAESRRLAGVVTDRDLVLQVMSHGLDARTVRIGEVMTREVVTARPEEDLREVERKMADAEIRRVPVVDEDGTVLGVISLHDVAQLESGARTGEVFREVAKASAQI